MRRPDGRRDGRRGGRADGRTEGRNRGTVRTSAPLWSGGGWQKYNRLVATGDVTGDHHPDLLARDHAGDLWLYTPCSRPRPSRMIPVMPAELRADAAPASGVPRLPRRVRIGCGRVAAQPAPHSDPGHRRPGGRPAGRPRRRPRGGPRAAAGVRGPGAARRWTLPVTALGRPVSAQQEPYLPCQARGVHRPGRGEREAGEVLRRGDERVGQYRGIGGREGVGAGIGRGIG